MHGHLRTRVEIDYSPFAVGSWLLRHWSHEMVEMSIHLQTPLTVPKTDLNVSSHQKLFNTYPPHTPTCQHHLHPSFFALGSLSLVNLHSQNPFLNSQTQPPLSSHFTFFFLCPFHDPQKNGGGTQEAMIMNSPSCSKTDQILSRYRPIAPKPPLVEGPTTPENTQQSPFSRNHSYLLARPSRNRKRGKSGCLPATKRSKASHLAFSSPCGVASLAKNTQLSLSLQSFGHGLLPQFPLPSDGISRCLEKSVNLVTLPFLPYPSSSSVTDVARSVPELHGISIYSQFQDISDLRSKSEIPQEMNLLQNLHATDSAPLKSGKGNVIAPQAMRPVGSSISVECIQEDPQFQFNKCVSKKHEEVEAEIELDTLPAVVSDSSNRVRLANSAYMEMVGQPECLWLNSMANCDGQLRSGACKRIGGKVMLDLSNSGMPVSADGFTCKARIEWGSNEEKSTISAHCDVVKLSCESKDYLFTWRFHTNESNSKA